MKSTLLVFSWSILLLAAACSDDTGSSTRDQGTEQPAQQDLGADSQADQATDRGEPQPEASLPEAGLDAGTDSIPPDRGLDQAHSDGPEPVLWGVVTRSVAPVLDARGTLYIGVVSPLFGSPLIIQGVDLSQPGAAIPYQFNWLDPGSYELWAFLDDNNDANFLFPGPNQGDLTMAANVPFTLGTSTLRLDIDLDKVAGVSPDAGIGDASLTVGAIRGQVSSTTAGPGDSKGTLYASLHTAPPPAGRVVMTAVHGVDLSSTYSSAVFYIGSVAAGSYYLRLFLDDNLSVGIFVQDPDKGDLIHDAIPVHVVAGATTTQDVVLDKVVP